MLQKTVIVGKTIEARTAAMFVQIANGFKSKVELIVDNKQINAKSIMGVISLGDLRGMKVTLVVDGTDEAPALDKLAEFIEQE